NIDLDEELNTDEFLQELKRRVEIEASLFSGLNNVVEYSLLDKRFSEYYGFTQEEVDDLLTKVPNIVSKNDIKD
ncbi:18462_t:CDS:2, partial [Gigaspora margarita]